MAEPRIADDYPFIAARLKELEGAKPEKWAVWYVNGAVWTHLEPGRKTKMENSDYPITLFDSEDAAQQAIAASGDTPRTRTLLIPKPYDPSA